MTDPKKKREILNNAKQDGDDGRDKDGSIPPKEQDEASSADPNKRPKRVWLHFSGHHRTRVGDAYQVSNLPVPDGGGEQQQDQQQQRTNTTSDRGRRSKRQRQEGRIDGIISDGGEFPIDTFYHYQHHQHQTRAYILKYSRNIKNTSTTFLLLATR